MKQFALLFLAILTLTSCGDDLEFSTPGFQANKNYNLWRATYYSGSLDADENLIITAGINNEEMTLTLSSASVGTYQLSTTSFSRADFTDFDGISYSTANPPDPSVSLYPEIGEVKITDFSGGTVTGSFRFIAYSEDGLKTVGFNEGVFYRIPIFGGNTNNGSLSCQDATMNLATATTNFNAVTPEDANYPAACAAYKTALQQQITACGDTGGVLQTIIDSLGDCSGNVEPQSIISVTVGTLPKTFEENISVDVTAGVMTIYAEDDLTDDWIFFKVDQNVTGTDVIQEFTIHLASTDYLPVATFTSEITTNTDTSIQGTFSGPVESGDGANLNLTQGQIDVMY